MLLTEKRPLLNKFEYQGRVFIINLTWNNVLSVFEVLEDKELQDVDKLLLTLFFLTGIEFENEIEGSKSEVVEQIISLNKFVNVIFDEFLYDASKREKSLPVDIAGNVIEEAIKDEKAKYSFTQDAEYIFASFMQAYNINLYEELDKMHYDVFMALLNGLPSDTKLMQVIDIRTRELPTGKGAEKEREKLKEAKRYYALEEGE